MRRVLGAIITAALMSGGLVLGASPPGYSTGISVADEAAPATPVITSPAHGDHFGTNNITVSGTGEPGAKVTVSDNGGGSHGPFLVSGAGNWSGLVSNLPEGDCEIWARQTDPAGNVSPASTPVFIVTSVPRPAAPTVDPIRKYVTTSRPVVRGSGVDGATVVVKHKSGKTFGTATVSSRGRWAVTSRTSLKRGVYSVAATQKVGSSTSARSPYRHFRVVSAKPAFYGPRVFSTRTPSLIGVGYPAARIYVKTTNGTTLGIGTVGPTGRWSIKSRTLSRPTYTIVAKQKYNNRFKKSGERVIRIRR